MPNFSYKARRSGTGEEVVGSQDAKDRFDLARMLRQQGLLLVSAEDGSAKKKFSMSKTDINIPLFNLLRKVSLTEKILFSKNIAVMIKAGLPLTRALEALDRESRNPALKKVLADLIDQVRKGKTLAESVGRHPKVFPPLYKAMIESGEKSGKLNESFDVLASHMQADYDLRKRVKGALTYPAVIIAAMVGIGILMMYYVVPTLKDVFNDTGAELPSTTQFVLGLSDFIRNHPLLILGGIVAFIVLVMQLVKTNVGRRFTDVMLLKIPIFQSLTRQFNAARTTRTLASLLSSGVQVMDALDIASRVVQNHLYSDVLVSAKAEIQKGNKISSVFTAHADLYPSLVGEMLAVGEETGSTPNMLNEMATFYERQVDDATKNLSTIIEPMLMVIIGIVVGFFAISMITPMYSLVDSI